ncbi:DUF4199 domain-containing protein [Robiginitalea sp. SC105]|uniref:DUF4199 domain-containing protein n=1 Tax=Robiginitalea sp. SC105 TaxID=2762332 RepID=UPI00163AACAD|nr:DUF4199 domain-containing protein [Robiginitalea sp. SC105]MBC2839434.1 DUF4199 domain-containing protein [Robiginitalea sp. SC105]
MEQNQPKTGKYSLNYGLILGVIGVAFALMLFLVDAHTTQSPVIQVVNIVISVAVIFWGILSFKKANGGLLSIGEALKLGAGIAVIAALIQVLYTILMANVLDPDFATKIMEARMADASSTQNMTPEQIEQSIEMGKKFFWFGYPVMLIVSVVFGLIIGLVGGLIFKKSEEA